MNELTLFLPAARLKAASFSYRSRPSERSPKPSPLTAEPYNGAPGSFRIKSASGASIFRRKEKRSKEQLNEDTKENGSGDFTKMWWDLVFLRSGCFVETISKMHGDQRKNLRKKQGITQWYLEKQE